LYKGKVVFEKEIDFRLKNIFSPVKNEVVIENYDLSLKVADSWGQKPCFNFNAELRYQGDFEPCVLKPDEGSGDSFIFDSLLPGSYNLFLNYQRFTYEKNIDIKSSNEIIDLVFPVEYEVDFKAYDSRGEILDDFNVELSRGEKNLDIDSENSNKIKIPPGSYNVKILSDDGTIAERNVNVVNNDLIDVVTSKEPLYPMIFTIISILSMIVFGFIYLRKKNYFSFMKIAALGFGIISIVSPWWMINGVSTSSDLIKTNYKMFVNPSSLIGYTNGPNIAAGELSQLPDVFVLALQSVYILIAIGCILLVLNLFLERFKKEKMEKYSLLGAVTCFITSIAIFFYSSLQFANISVGGFIGSGDLNFDIPGGAADTTFSSNWGPDIGFYLILAGLISIILILIVKWKKELDKIENKKKFLKQNLFRYAKKILPIIGLIVIIYLIFSIGIENIISSFLKFSPTFLVVIFSISILSTLIGVYQWRLIQKTQNIHVSFLNLLKILLISNFYSSISPGRIGTWMKVPYLKEVTGEPYGKLFINCLIFSAISTISLFCIVLFGSFLLIDILPIVFIMGFMVFAALLLLILFFSKKERGNKGLKTLIRYFVPKKAKPTFEKFTKTFYNDFPKAKYLVLPFLISFIGLIISYANYYIIALSIGINIDFHIFVGILAVIGSMQLIPIPGFVGIRKLSMVYVFSLFGVAAADAFAFSMLPFILLGIPHMFVGFILSILWAKNSKKNNIKNFSFEKMIGLSSD
jgi:uncharacterized protein (TIRG00374 family)